MPAAVPRALRRGPRWLRSVRRRPSAFLTLAVLSGLAVIVAASTPLLLHAAETAVLADAFATAGTGAAVVASAQSDDADSAAFVDDSVRSATRRLRSPRWGATVDVTTSFRTVTWTAAGRAAQTSFVSLARQGCPGLRVTAGRCPIDDDEAMLPASTERRLRLPLGSMMTIPLSRMKYVEFAVVGVYDDEHGYGRVLGRPGALAGFAVSVPNANLAVSELARGHLAYGWDVLSSATLRNPVTTAELTAIRADVQAARDTAADSELDGVGVRITTRVPELLDEQAVQRASAEALVGAIALQALVLAWFALGVVIQRIARTRAPEWGIGRTRGVPRRTWLAAVFAEPAVAVLAGGVVGYPVAVGLAAIGARLALSRYTVLEPFAPAPLAVAGLAVAGSLVALLAATIRSTRIPLPALLREATEPRELSRVALVAQSGAVLLAVAVLWATLTAPVTDGAQVALAAPALIAFVVAVAALRAATALLRRSTTRAPRTIPGLVVVRQLARAPSGLSVSVLLTVGVALGTYSLQLATVASRLAEDRADTAVGASTVLHVTDPDGADLMAAVRRADPGGREAMAVREVDGQAATRIVAVDSTRLDAVSVWRPEWRGASGAAAGASLDPATGSAPVLRGTVLRATVSDVRDGLRFRLRDEEGVRPVLVAVVVTPDGWRTVRLGPLRQGVLRSAPGDFPCANGCRLVAVGGDDSAQSTIGSWGASFELGSLTTDAQDASALSPWLQHADRWRDRLVSVADPSRPAVASATSTGAGLRIDLEDAVGSNIPMLEPAVGPALLPAIIADGTGLQPFAGVPHGAFGADTTGGPLLLDLVGRASALPRSLGDGVLVDLSQLQRVSDTTARTTDDEVWLAPGPHTALIARLARAGIRVTATERLAPAVAAAADTAPVQALRLALAASAAAVLLTLLGLVGQRIAGAAARRHDRRSLAVAGLSSARLRLVAALETAGPAVAGVLLGILAGLLAEALTVPQLPLAPAGASPPLDLSPPLGAVGALAAVVLGAVLLVGLVAARLEVPLPNRDRTPRGGSIA